MHSRVIISGHVKRCGSREKEHSQRLFMCRRRCIKLMSRASNAPLLTSKEHTDMTQIFVYWALNNTYLMRLAT